uniref:Uncharacterized protein n=1 Tax=Mycena chlorophos TaxID=658473 RepID=A0ABQ0LX32_MYCCL|nr:predicted protein [Mycena chlorophos]
MRPLRPLLSALALLSYLRGSATMASQIRAHVQTRLRPLDDDLDALTEEYVDEYPTEVTTDDASETSTTSPLLPWSPQARRRRKPSIRGFWPLPTNDQVPPVVAQAGSLRTSDVDEWQWDEDDADVALDDTEASVATLRLENVSQVARFTVGFADGYTTNTSHPPYHQRRDGTRRRRPNARCLLPFGHLRARTRQVAAMRTAMWRNRQTRGGHRRRQSHCWHPITLASNDDDDDLVSELEYIDALAIPISTSSHSSAPSTNLAAACSPSSPSASTSSLSSGSPAPIELELLTFGLALVVYRPQSGPQCGL